VRFATSVEAVLRRTSIDPDADPRSPRLSSPLGFLCWLLLVQRWRGLRGTFWGSSWMAVLTLPPYFVSRAVDDGLRAGDHQVLAFWVAAIVLTGVANGLLGIARHRTMTLIRLDATTRTLALIDAKMSRLGARHARRSSTGEVLAIGAADTGPIAQTLTIAGPGVGAVVATVLVAVLLLRISVPLALVVLIGVPVVTLLLGPLVRAQQRAHSHYRDLDGELTGQAADIASGLVVISGLGNTRRIADDFEEEVLRLRGRGFRVAAVTSWLQATTASLPVLFLAVVTWLAAHLAAEDRLSIGDLLAVYGYVAVLAVPVSTFVEGIDDLGRGLVAARRAINFLSIPEAPEGPPTSVGSDTTHPTNDQAGLVDCVSGLRVAPGSLVAVVAIGTDVAALTDRLCGRGATPATWGGAPGRDRAPLVVHHGSLLFPGTLRETLTTRDDTPDEVITAAIRAAAADDVLAGLPDGLDSDMPFDARNVSGGQRQRLLITRALVHDPEVLVLVEPTSAVDSRTEAAVAAGVRAARAGRTTVVLTSSPVVLAEADTVALVSDDRVVAAGPHGQLLNKTPAYRQAVSQAWGGAR
jgi:ABC-type bacteriocin/lantibiotic exporter with double-glycine peptidase domain